MQAKAHIPAGITAAALATLLSGAPLDPVMLIGGAIGGALPDIDVAGDDGQGSAVQHLGERASGAMRSTVVLSPLARVTQPVGQAFDLVVLGPLCRGWRLLAGRALAPAYLAVAQGPVGRVLRLDRDDPSAHRGGLTHSLLAMGLFSLVILPLCRLAGVPRLWEGIMWGFLSHLLCDAVCKSGVKFLWPWAPNIGFRNEDGVGGREGIKLLPAGALMKTGKCTSRAELRRHLGERGYGDLAKCYWLETGWRVLFQLTALAVPAMVVLGVGPASGTIEVGPWSFDVAGKQAAAALASTTDQTLPVEDQVGAVSQADAQVAQADADDPLVTSASDAAQVDGGRGVRVDEHKGPTSLTYGDVDATALPRGIAKMPDESLWVLGVGPVNTETLSDPSVMLTDEEKQALIAAANWQRRSGSGGGLAGLADDRQVAEDVTSGNGGGIGGLLGGDGPSVGPIGGTLPDGNDLIIDPGTPSQGSDGGILDGLLGDGGIMGFHGLTPFTQGGEG